MIARTRIASHREAGTRPGWFRLVAIVLVILSGGLCVLMPFWGDQAIFTLYAREITRGAVLYRDLFDLKQPGIFMFYAAGGLLLGFSEVAMHVFELAYWLAFAVFVMLALRPYFAAEWGPPLVPVFTVCAYYCYSSLLHLGQVEMIVGFPLLAAWWLVDGAGADPWQRTRRYAVAGLMAAAVVMLKHLYLLVIVAFLAHAVIRDRRHGIASADLLRSLTAFLAIMCLPLAAALAYFAAHGQLERLWWAYVEISASAQLLQPRPVEYLIAGARQFLIGHGPPLILAMLACVHLRRAAGGRQRDLIVGMLLWGVAGTIAFPVLQSWPEYKWPLFTVPVGVLAVIGAERLVEAMRAASAAWRVSAAAAAAGGAVVSFAAGGAGPHVQTRLLVAVLAGTIAAASLRLAGRDRFRAGVALTALTAALGGAAGLSARAPAGKLLLLARHDFGITASSRTELQYAWHRGYAAADADLARVRQRRQGQMRSGPLYVFGDPILYLRADRPQAVPILGWGPEFLDRRAWEELHRDLRSAVPPYIVVTEHARSLIAERCPAILGLLASRYAVALEGASGTWYERR